VINTQRSGTPKTPTHLQALCYAARCAVLRGGGAGHENRVALPWCGLREVLSYVRAYGTVARRPVATAGLFLGLVLVLWPFGAERDFCDCTSDEVYDAAVVLMAQAVLGRPGGYFELGPHLAVINLSAVRSARNGAKLFPAPILARVVSNCASSGLVPDGGLDPGRSPRKPPGEGGAFNALVAQHTILGTLKLPQHVCFDLAW